MYLLSGCDSTSRLFGIGKGIAFKKLNQEYLKEQTNILPKKVFCLLNVPYFHLFAYCHFIRFENNPFALLIDVMNKQHQQEFTAKVITGNTSVHVKSLPPTSDSANFNSLRVYYQCQMWMLETVDITHTSFGVTILFAIASNDI
jgi:hypothetical protein